MRSLEQIMTQELTGCHHQNKFGKHYNAFLVKVTLSTQLVSAMFEKPFPWKKAYLQNLPNAAQHTNTASEVEIPALVYTATR